MKKLILAAIVATSPMTVMAKSLTVNYPEKYCDQILSQEYSTGGGNSMVQYLEILCVDKNGKYRGFVDSWGSVGGFFGAGRFTTPDSFIYVPYGGETMNVE